MKKRQAVLNPRAAAWSGGQKSGSSLMAFTRLRAFSLLELLAAMTVMTLLLFLLLQVANHTLQASKTATQKLDSTQAARKAVDVLAGDIGHALTTEGATLLVQNSGTVSLSFLTSGRGPDTTPTRFLAVNYQCEDDKIIRRFHPVSWDGTADRLNDAAAAAAAANRTVLATGILQFAVFAVLENGDLVSVLAPPGNAAGVSGSQLFEGQQVPSGWTAIVPSYPPIPSPLNADNSRVRALLVAVASIDEQNLSLLTDKQKTAFKNEPSFTSDPVAVWETVLQEGDFPGPARSSVRFYSRVIPLP